MELIRGINKAVWGPPILLLILGVGILLTIRTRFAQLRYLPQAFRAVFQKKGRVLTDGTTSFQALCTALAATVGTGNIAGVAGAIAIGGPGAVFWIWVSGFLGMIVKYSEAVLAVRFQERNRAGERVGGPMFVIRRALPGRWQVMAPIYCVFGVVAAFGVGNAAQVNAVVGTLRQAVGEEGPASLELLTGIILAALVGSTLSGGAGKVGRAAEKLIPFAAVVYVIMGTVVLLLNSSAVPGVFLSIIRGAFQPSAVTGGIVGSSFQCLRVGISRGVFTNEAGMGTAAIAHGAAATAHPGDQGLMGILEVFIDTILICTLTALVILCSGVPITYGVDIGAELTSQAFQRVLGNWAGTVLAIEVCLFAFATILGWGLYGGRCVQFLFGDKAWPVFGVIQTVMVALGAVIRTDLVWLLAEVFNGLMAIPNLIALAVLIPETVALTISFDKKRSPRSNRGDQIRSDPPAG